MSATIHKGRKKKYAQHIFSCLQKGALVARGPKMEGNLFLIAHPF